ncbi:MAG TPA: class I SAM-dependent methyltransferase [Natronosporangium sp.]
MEITAYLVNESRARRPELARDPLAAEWIPEAVREDVRRLWQEYASDVYPYDDLVVSLRCRCVLDALAGALAAAPDTVLVVCGAGFTSYPWLLPFPVAVEVDLPRIIDAKRDRTRELVAAGVVKDRQVAQLAADLADEADRRAVVEQVRELAAGRPVAYVAEGLIFYLSAGDARAVAGLGTAMSERVLSVVSYWPAAARDNQVLAAQRAWFRRHQVPEQPTLLTVEELAAAIGSTVDNHSPEDMQRRYLGEVTVTEPALVPEHVAIAGAVA